MTELQRGTAVIPTIDANGAPVSEAMSVRIRLMVEGIKHLPLQVEMHPDQVAAWENCGMLISTVVRNQAVQKAVLDIARPLCTFAGFPVRRSLEYPRNEIRVVFDSKGRKTDGSSMGSWITAQIINLELPSYAA